MAGFPSHGPERQILIAGAALGAALGAPHGGWWILAGAGIGAVGIVALIALLVFGVWGVGRLIAGVRSRLRGRGAP